MQRTTSSLLQDSFFCCSSVALPRSEAMPTAPTSSVFQPRQLCVRADASPHAVAPCQTCLLGLKVEKLQLHRICYFL